MSLILFLAWHSTSIEWTLGYPRRMWILVLSTDLTSFLLSLVEEECLLLLRTYFSFCCGSSPPWRLPLPAFSVPQSLLAVLFLQANGFLNHNGKKPNLPLILYVLLVISPSISFALQPEFMDLSIKPKLFSSSRQALIGLALALYLLPFPTSFCW